MPSRRRLLQGGATLAGLTLAGCLDVVSDGPGGTNEASGWTYDAAERFGVSTVAAATVDLGAVLDAPLSESLAGDVERADANLESVDFEAIETVALTGFVDVDDELTGGSAVALGEFDPEAVGEELAADGAEPVETEYDVDRYDDEHGGSLAVREDVLVFGGVSGRSGRDIDPVAAALDAGNGDARPFAERENGATLAAELSGDVTAGVDLGAGLRRELGSNLEGAPGPAAAVVEATDAFGVDATFGGETTELTYVLVADPGALDVETVREFADAVEGVDDSTIQDVAVSRDGRAVVATAEAETATLVDSHTGVLQPSPEAPERRVPQVAFAIERTADDRVRVLHEGGDAVERPPVVAYEGVDGFHEEVWRATPITAGDEFVSTHGAGTDATVRVVWESEDGSEGALLAQATV